MTSAHAKHNQKAGKLLGVFYHSLCLFFLMYAAIYIFINNGSWINYFIIFLALAVLSLAWHLFKRLVIKSNQTPS
jgi:ABC-type transport system involved in multi-copper enzyme maturation permease subunit